jgi:hypothetical protein
MSHRDRRLLTGVEHRREAERLLSQASHVRSDEDPTPHLDAQTTALLIARAQVHATLAASAGQDADVVEARIHDDHDSPFDRHCRTCVEDADWAVANVRTEIRLHEEALSNYVGTFTVAEEVAPGHVLRWEALKVLLAEREEMLKTPANTATPRRGSDDPPW